MLAHQILQRTGSLPKQGSYFRISTKLIALGAFTTVASISHFIKDLISEAFFNFDMINFKHVSTGVRGLGCFGI